MQEATKKTLLVKVKAVGRTLKQYKAYKQQVQSFDINEVSQDKKKGDFYNESKSALQSVKKNLIQFVQQFESTINEYNDKIVEANDQALNNELEKGKQFVAEARTLLPAQL